MNTTTLLYLFIGALIFYYLFLNNSNNSVNNFMHQLPKERYPDVVAEFGEPSYTINKPGGVAIWKNPQFFTKVMLKDESIEHKKPKPHCDFLYSSVNVHIPDSVLMDVLMLSESVTYDRLKKQLTARCHHKGPNVSTLLLAMKIAKNPRIKNQLYNKYGEMIMESMNKQNYNAMKTELQMLVEENQQMFGSIMPNTKCMIKA